MFLFLTRCSSIEHVCVLEDDALLKSKAWKTTFGLSPGSSAAPSFMTQRETLNRPAIRRELLDCLWCPPTRRCPFFCVVVGVEDKGGRLSGN